jgi:hypothetical protein
MRPMRRAHSYRFLAIAGLPLFTASCSGCEKKPAAGEADAGGLPSVVATAAAASAANAASPVDGGNAPSTSACRVDVAPFVMDAKVRTESDVTVVKLDGEERIAVGYASGDVPKVVLVEATAGKASDAPVEVSALPPAGDAKTVRKIHRVTPIESKDANLRVAVDLTETRPDKTRLVWCGPADGQPIFVFDGRSLHDEEGGGIVARDVGDAGDPGANDEVRECRTFYDPSGAWALGSQPRRDGTKYESRWLIGASGGRTVPEPSIERRELTAGADGGVPRAERNTFEAFAGLKVEGAGYVAASRINGQLHVSRRRSELEPMGTVATFWPNAAVGTPVLASTGSTVSLVFALMGKPDLMGLVFPLDTAPKPPQKIDVEQAPEGADRISVSSTYLPRGDLAVAFAEGTAKTRRARMTLLDAQLRPRGALVDAVPEGANVRAVRLLSLGEDRVFVAYLDLAPSGVHALKGLVLACN